MTTWCEFNDTGDLPPGIYRASLNDVIENFGRGSLQRWMVAERLRRIHTMVVGTGEVHRFIIFGSFVTDKADPQDIDIFLLMKDTFDVGKLSGESRVLFDHLSAQNCEGASIFWMRVAAAQGGEDAVVEHWQVKRDGTKRGIVEVLIHDS